MGRNMNDLVSNDAFGSEVAVYNGANDEEVTEFILSTLREISIMAYSMDFTSQERQRIVRSIELFEGCVSETAGIR
jgi:hypothetical protein